MRRIKSIFAPIIILGLILAACTASANSDPTPTIVPLDRTELEAVPAAQATPPATPTPIPLPSPTPTPTPFPTVALTGLLTTTSSMTTTSPVTRALVGTTTVVSSTARLEVLTTALYVREGPGLDFAIRGGAWLGDQFVVTGINPSGRWLQIVANDGSLTWISARPDYVGLSGATRSSLPVIGGQATSFRQPASTDPSPASSQSNAPPSGSPNPSGGRIVFATRSGGDLYLINADGTGLRRLAGGVIDPVVSPDAQQVAFTRWDGAEIGTLYTINLDGSGERAIMGDTLQAKSPTWSPDGQKIVLSFQHGGLRNPVEECRTFDADDGIRIPRNVVITKTHFSRNGELTICFLQNEDLRWALRQVDLTSGAFEDLSSDQYSYNPAWDPLNLWRVIYDGDKGLMQIDVTNNNLWPVTRDLRDTGPVFSPEGQRLALTYKQHDHWEVYTYDLNSGARQRLTKPPILADPQYNSAAPAWSPDGQQLAFFTDRTGSWEIWVMNVDGSNPRPLFTPEIQTQLGLMYNGVNERLLNWIQ